MLKRKRYRGPNKKYFSLDYLSGKAECGVQICLQNLLTNKLFSTTIIRKIRTTIMNRPCVAVTNGGHTC